MTMTTSVSRPVQFGSLPTSRFAVAIRSWLHLSFRPPTTSTLEAYAEQMKRLFTPLPGAHYGPTDFATDPERAMMVAPAVIRAIQTGEGGPVPPTGKTIAADDVYAMPFDGDEICDLTKIWNDVWSLKALGWP